MLMCAQCVMLVICTNNVIPATNKNITLLLHIHGIGIGCILKVPFTVLWIPGAIINQLFSY